MRYNPSDFEPYLIEGPLPEDAAARPWHGPAGALAPVLAHCRFLQHCRNDASTLSEPEWWAMVSNLARLDGGRMRSTRCPRPIRTTPFVRLMPKSGTR